MDNLGVLYISAGRIAEASKLYKDLHEMYSDYVEGRVHFAQVLMQERSFQQAEQLLQSVIKENITHRDALHQLSLLYSQVNRTTEPSNSSTVVVTAATHGRCCHVPILVPPKSCLVDRLLHTLRLVSLKLFALADVSVRKLCDKLRYRPGTRSRFKIARSITNSPRVASESSSVHEVWVQVVCPFPKSTESVSDPPQTRSGRLASSVSDENIEKVRKLIPKARQLTVRSIADELQISSESVRQITMHNLGMRIPSELHLKRRYLTKFPGHV
ncbi:transmembrane and TPR repeat-containing protein 1 [Trichonephila clavipes]|nr:transmembrane and TPR repeat-containing protein 1 [Trichonephila clavipes]